MITKLATSAHRATVNQVKVVSIWVFFLIYNDHGTGETFLPIQLAGFIVLVLGVCIFNEIIVIPIFGFNRNTKANLMKEEYRKSMKLLWNVQDDQPQEEDLMLKKTIRMKIEDNYGLGRKPNQISRVTIFGASEL